MREIRTSGSMRGEQVARLGRLLSYSTVFARNLFFEPVDDPDDSILNQAYVEIDEQSQALIGKTQVCHQLLLMHRRNQFQRFDLDNDFVFHNQVGPKAVVDAKRVVNDRNRMLAQNPEAPAFQFMRKDCLVNGFQKARSQARVNPVRGIHDLSGQGIFGHRVPSRL